MKTILSSLVLMFIIVSISSAQETQSRKEKRQEKRETQFKEIEQLIDSINYKFIATKANPSGGGQIDLTTHIAYLRVANDSAEAYLPFFGRAYNAAYNSGDSGIKFETEHVNYKVTKNVDKLNFIISFSAKTSKENYQCTLSITSSGSATLSVNSNHKAFISYYGNIESINNPEESPRGVR